MLHLRMETSITITQTVTLILYVYVPTFTYFLMKPKQCCSISARCCGCAENSEPEAASIMKGEYVLMLKVGLPRWGRAKNSAWSMQETQERQVLSLGWEGPPKE